MAGDWIKVKVTLHEETEVIGMSAILGLDQYGIVGRLIRVWSWADQHTTDGDALHVTPAFVDCLTSFDGFADAMQQVGWLDVVTSESTESLRIPNFDVHNGESAKKRAQTAKRNAKYRAGKRDGNGKRDAGRVTNASPREREEKEKNLPPPLSPSSDAESSEWKSVEDELFCLGMDLAAKAVNKAWDVGCSAADIRAVIAHYRKHSGSWGVGALYKRITDASVATLPPDRGWPSPDPRAIEKKRRKAESEQIDANHARLKERERAAESRRKEKDRLESIAGEKLDNMTQSDCETLLNGDAAHLKALRDGWQKHGNKNPLLRTILLKRIADQSEQA